ncbi:MAG: nuclease ue [Verrucomicrobiota bacterium]|jgi:endonuclease YncB( thermonuclease family)
MKNPEILFTLWPRFFGMIVAGVLLVLGTSVAQARSVTATVVRVIDGNTFQLKIQKTNVRVVLSGISAPVGTQEFASEAKALLSRLVLNQRVRIQFKGSKVKPRVSALVLVVGRSGAGSVNVQMARAGLAKATTGGEIAQAEAEARADQIGLFSVTSIPNPIGNPGSLVIPSGWVVTGSEETIPFDSSLSTVQRAEIIAKINEFYVEVDRLIRGRTLVISNPTLGFGGAVDIERSTQMDLCANGTFERRFVESGLGIATDETIQGTWRIRVDLTTLDGIDPVLELITNATPPVTLNFGSVSNFV